MRIVQIPQDPSKPEPLDRTGYFTWCDKHQQAVAFQVSKIVLLNAYEPNRVLESAAKHAVIQHCPNCIKEKEETVVLPQTRWPNGGDEGGAEL
jgi:hypothetical protein